jgi:N-acetylneuraminic acid mutarotase
MSKSVALLLLLVFLSASCVIAAKPVSAASTVENSWVAQAPLRQARYSCGLAVVGNKIYAIGGSSLKGTSSLQHGFLPTAGMVLNSVEEYDPMTDTWIGKTKMPTARYGFTTIVCENKIYCLGGSIDHPPYGAPTKTNAFEVYDPATNGWTAKNPMPMQVTSYAAIPYQDKIYFISGFLPPNELGVSKEMNLNQVYDIHSDTWENKTSMPTARQQFIANVVNGKFYIMGGGTNVTEVYDPSTDSWTTGKPVPDITYSAPSCVVDGKIYVLSSRLLIYDPQTDIWTIGAQPPQSLHGSAFATVGAFAPKQIYVLFNQTMKAYNPMSDSWSSAASFPSSIYGESMAMVNDKIYAVGGNTYTTSPNSLGLPWYPDETISPLATNWVYTPIGYGTVPLKIEVISPQGGMTYSATNCSLIFNLNRPADSISYSIDGKEKVLISGNTTIPDLTIGTHTVTIYAEDSFGNNVTSEAVTFNILFETFQILLISVAVTIGVVIAVIGLLLYFKKRRR